MAEENKNTDNKLEPKAINVDELLDKRQKETRAKFEKKPKHYLDMNLSWPMLIILSLAIFGIGYAYVNQSSLATGYRILYIVVSLLAGVLIYNLGKLIGAAIDGYEVYRVEFFGLQVLKDGKKQIASFRIADFFEFHIDYAPKKEDNRNMALYLCGSLLDTVAFIVVLVLSFVLKNLPLNLAITLRYGSILAFLTAFYEMFPGKLDVFNDMYRLIVSSSEEDRIAYNKYLIALKNDYLGKPNEKIIYDDYSSRAKALTLLPRLHEEVYDDEYQNALKTIELADEKSVSLPEADKCEIISEELYLYLSHGRTKEAESLVILFDKRVKNTADYHPSVSALRTSILIAGLLDSSREGLDEALKDFTEELKRVGKNERTVKDLAFVKEALSRISRSHPDWGVKPLNEKDIFAAPKAE